MAFDCCFNAKNILSALLIFNLLFFLLTKKKAGESPGTYLVRESESRAGEYTLYVAYKYRQHEYMHIYLRLYDYNIYIYIYIYIYVCSL